MPLNPLVQRLLDATSQNQSGPDQGARAAQQQSSLLQQFTAPAATTAPPQGGGGGFWGQVGGGNVDIDRILRTIRQRESGGNYTAKNPYSSASGAYQFIDSTWGGYGGYKQAWMAPQAVQDARARQHVQEILGRYKNDLWAVPAAWYTGSYRGRGNLDYRPGGPGNPLTVLQYVQKWLADWERYG